MSFIDKVASIWNGSGVHVDLLAPEATQPGQATLPVVVGLTATDGTHTVTEVRVALRIFVHVTGVGLDANHEIANQSGSDAEDLAVAVDTTRRVLEPGSPAILHFDLPLTGPEFAARAQYAFAAATQEADRSPAIFHPHQQAASSFAVEARATVEGSPFHPHQTVELALAVDSNGLPIQ